MHTGLYNRNRKGRNNNFVDPAELLEDGLYDLELEERLGGDDLLMEYVTELMNWNRVYNLTSVRKPTDIVTRHILDSLTILPHLHGERILDIGTGAGLPGIPLAIATDFIASGRCEVTGVVIPERAFNPADIFKELSKREIYIRVEERIPI